LGVEIEAILNDPRALGLGFVKKSLHLTVNALNLDSS